MSDFLKVQISGKVILKHDVFYIEDNETTHHLDSFLRSFIGQEVKINIYIKEEK